MFFNSLFSVCVCVLSVKLFVNWDAFFFVIIIIIVGAAAVAVVLYFHFHYFSGFYFVYHHDCNHMIVRTTRTRLYYFIQDMNESENILSTF